MKTLLLTFLALLFIGCSTIPLSYSGGDGSSPAQAVIIRGARHTEAGIAAENAWIRQHYPGARKIMQSLQTVESKLYDVIEFQTTDGQTKSIYFDITDFFGK